jgi:hypothetical protein
MWFCLIWQAFITLALSSSVCPKRKNRSGSSLPGDHCIGKIGTPDLQLNRGAWRRRSSLDKGRRGLGKTSWRRWYFN